MGRLRDFHDNPGMRAHDVRTVEQLVYEHRALLLEKYREHHP